MASIKIMGYSLPKYGEYILAKDIAKMIDHDNPAQMLIDAGIDKDMSRQKTNGGPQNMLACTMTDLRKILNSSRKPFAVKYRSTKKQVKDIFNKLNKRPFS